MLTILGLFHNLDWRARGCRVPETTAGNSQETSHKTTRDGFKVQARFDTL